MLGLVIQLTSQHKLQCLMAVLALWAMTVSNACLQATQRTLGCSSSLQAAAFLGVLAHQHAN